MNNFPFGREDYIGGGDHTTKMSKKKKPTNVMARLLYNTKTKIDLTILLMKFHNFLYY